MKDDLAMMKCVAVVGDQAFHRQREEAVDAAVDEAAGRAGLIA